jgi:hypothetical protein
MLRRRLLAIALCAAAAGVLAAPAAHAGSGGSLSGELSIEWVSDPARAQDQAWNGAVTLALEPGAAATERAAAAIRDSGRTYREVRPFFVQSSQVTALRMSRFTRFAAECWDSEGNLVPGESRHDETITAVTRPLVPLSVDQPSLDLLRGKGSVDAGFYTDNRGYAPGSETYPFPEAGGYFMPLPGIATAAASHTTCGEVRDDSGERAVFSTQGDATVPFAVALHLNEVDLPLERRGDAWVVDYTHSEQTTEDGGPDPLGLTVGYRAQLTLEGSLREIGARCRVPGNRLLRKARSPRAVRAIFRRAGFPRSKYLGKRPMLGGRPGRFIRDPDLSSSGSLPCGSRGRFLQMARWRG